MMHGMLIQVLLSTLPLRRLILASLLLLAKDLRTGQILMDGIEVDRMYKLGSRDSTLAVPQCHHVQFTSSPPAVKDASTVHTLSLWHQRLGHPALNTVKTTLQNAGISFTTPSVLSLCQACQYGKAHKLPFSVSSTVYNKPLDLIAMDLWGPAPIPSHGFGYYIAFVDAFSRFTWIYSLHKKSDALQRFKTFKLLVENKFSTKIKAIQSDNGGEFMAFKAFTTDCGIDHRFTCPHTSEQNGLVERRHRSIVETGLSLLAHAGLSLSFWSDAFCTAVFLLNRVPSTVIGNISPCEKLYGVKPDYSILKVFGCACYPLLRPYNSHKLEFRSSQCLFLGYSSHHRGYICLDIKSGRTYISRHVRFDELLFPKFDSTLVSFAPSCSLSASFCPPPKPSPSCSSPSSTSSSSLSSPIMSSSTSPTSSSLPLSSSLTPSSSSVPNSPSSATSHIASPPSTALAQPPPPSLPHNSHPMITRGKVGIFKPKVFMALEEVSPPATIDEAFRFAHWKAAAEDEYNALLKYHTWDVVPLPSGRKPIGCKWLFKTKLNADGSPARYKGRLVAKGYVQEIGTDYTDTFSPVVKSVTIRIILTVAVTNGWFLHQVDFNNAFLNGDLQEEVYMDQPPGFVQTDATGQQLVCCLNKAIYGLKQAPRAWFQKLVDALTQLGFHQYKSDSCLFIYNEGADTIYLLAYVDDLVITGSSEVIIKQLISKMGVMFSLKDLGRLSFFLGIEFTHTSAGLLLTQQKYVTQLLEKTNLLLASTFSTPMSTKSQLKTGDSALFSDASLYRSVLGTLQYVCYTRPDIAFTVNKLSQFMHEPTIQQWKCVDRLLRYLKGTSHFGLLIKPAAHFRVQAFADADWGGNKSDMRSTSGFCTYLGANPITWTSNKQQVVSRSATEAEYRSVADTVSDVLWTMSLLKEMNISVIDTPSIWCDNSGAVALASNPVLHKKSKHFELDLHFIREKVAAGLVTVGYVPSFDQVADVFTKAQSGALFRYCRNKLNVTSLLSPVLNTDDDISDADTDVAD